MTTGMAIILILAAVLLILYVSALIKSRRLAAKNAQLIKELAVKLTVEQQRSEYLRQDMLKLRQEVDKARYDEVVRAKDDLARRLAPADPTEDQIVLRQVLDLLEDEDFDEGDAVIATVAIRRHLGLD